MKTKNTVKGTIDAGDVVARNVECYLGREGSGMIGRKLRVGINALAGVTWVGLLYYFNFVQVPAMAEALSDEGGPGPAAIGKYIAPKALLWFRMSAAVTWLTGAWALSLGYGFTNAFLLKPGAEMIGLGSWLGTIMLFNVWVLIWPNQKKILGMVEASAEEIAKAKFTAAMASRTNVVLSVQMLLCMIGAGHGGYLF